MRKLSIVLFASSFLLLPIKQAQASCTGQAPSLTFCGNDTGSTGLPNFVAVTPSLITMPGGTVLGNPTSSTALAESTIAPVLGIPGASTGTIGFAGTTSGTATITPQSAAGAPTLTLPNTSGTFAVNASAPLSLDLTTGALTLPGTAGEVLAGATPAFTATPTLGVAGSLQGALSFAGATSGSALVTAQAAAGTPTLTLPNATGTFAVNASSPLVLSATTGNLTCPTCVTGTSGALTLGTTPTSGYSNTQILSSDGSKLAAYSVSGTGNVALTTSPTFVTPTLGAATATTINGNTITTGTGTLTLGAGKTLTASNSITIAGTDGKTLTVGNSLGFTGTDSTSFAFPSSSDTVATLAATQTLTNKTLNCASNTCTVRIGSDVSGLGTGVATALGVNIGTAGAFVVNGGALGTPSSGTGTNLTGIPISTGISGLGTGIATALAVNTGTAGAPAILIAKGATAMGTSAISSGSCASVVTATATGVQTTDAISATFNADPTSTTGYIPSTSGMLTIIMYPTAGNVNFKVCNNTASSITPGAVTINWRVAR